MSRGRVSSSSSGGAVKQIFIISRNRETLLSVSYSEQDDCETQLELSKQMFTKLSKFACNIPVLSKMLTQLISNEGSTATKLLKPWINGLKKSAWTCGLADDPQLTDMLSVASICGYDTNSAFPKQSDIDDYSNTCTEYATPFGIIEALPEMLENPRKVIMATSTVSGIRAVPLSSRIIPVVTDPIVRLVPQTTPTKLPTPKHDDVYAPIENWRNCGFKLDDLKKSEWYEDGGKIAPITLSDNTRTGSMLMTDLKFNFFHDQSSVKKIETFPNSPHDREIFTSIVFYDTKNEFNVDFVIKNSTLFYDRPGCPSAKVELVKYGDRCFGINANSLCTGDNLKFHLRSEKKFDWVPRAVFRYTIRNTVCRYDAFVSSIVKHFETREQIIGKLLEGSSDDDSEKDDVLGLSETISLKCPLSQNTIMHPVRGYSCKHLQCFDLIAYLEYNLVCKPKSMFKCPICNHITLMGDLFLDGLTESILVQYVDGLDPDTSNYETFSICCSTGEISYAGKQIQFPELLSKRTHPYENAIKPPRKKKKKDLVVLDD